MSTVETRIALPTGIWTADAAHSRVEFAVEYMVGTFRGSFSPFQATLDVDETGEAKLSGSTWPNAVKVQDENLEAHLQSPDFFDAERAPEISFESADITRDGDILKIVGELTIKGTAKPVTLAGTISDPITDPYGQERIGVKLVGEVDRTEFGLTWNVPLPTGKPALADDVTISAELYLVKG